MNHNELNTVENVIEILNNLPGRSERNNETQYNLKTAQRKL